MKAVLFDLDGVITLERIYWNCSGLALARFLGKNIPKSEKEKIRLAQETLPDSVILGFKRLGINSNWDISYATSILSRAGKTSQWLFEEMKKRDWRNMDYLKLLDEIENEKHDREGGPWKNAHKRFQTCYYELRDSDDTVISVDKIKAALDEIKKMGLKMGIVTGRPYEEAKRPLQRWGLWDYFEPELIITENEVAEESKKRGEYMGKPHAWPILTAIFNHEKCTQCEIDSIKNDYVLVGDSISDVRAAKSAGIRVICVKTGIVSAEELKNAGADIVVDDMTAVPNAL
jgi:phosphoglycolate phosphatase-like HAD superfamily hydrolase